MLPGFQNDTRDDLIGSAGAQLLDLITNRLVQHLLLHLAVACRARYDKNAKLEARSGSRSFSGVVLRAIALLDGQWTGC